MQNTLAYTSLVRPAALLFITATTCLTNAPPTLADKPADRSETVVNSADLANEVRAILSNRCFACHGPDPEERQGGLRLDDRESFTSESDSGFIAVVPESLPESELVRRITDAEEWERMPPPDFGGKLSDNEVTKIKLWIEQGASLPQHWSFIPPVASTPPSDNVLNQQSAINHSTTPWVQQWLNQPIDRFTLQQMLNHGFTPSAPASRSQLLRRLSLDLTGLPPSLDEIHRFEQDESPEAYELQVDRLLASPAFGEHWARKWLDLARYADSAGYADDPPRTIWAYRDWVINALNENKPIDSFTIEQLAGDLLPNPTQDQLIATAFHRNTLTNNEGGTNDEEFRNVAVVDRVNTTFSVWMGVTMACAQCHTHKYDPFTHEEYFALFDIFNQTEDADRRNESPILELLTDEQIRERESLSKAIQRQREALKTPSAKAMQEYADWRDVIKAPSWSVAIPNNITAESSQVAEINGEGRIQITSPDSAPGKATYTIRIPLALGDAPINAIGIRSLPQPDLPGGGAGQGNGNFVLTNIGLRVVPQKSTSVTGQFIRIELPGEGRLLSLAEVEVVSGGSNIAPSGKATQSSTDYSGVASRAIDGTTNGDYQADSTTHSATENDPWWELDLREAKTIDQVTLWNRTDNQLQKRLEGAEVVILDSNRNELFRSKLETAPENQTTVAVSAGQSIELASAYADYSQPNFPASNTIDAASETGWAVGGRITESHLLTILPSEPISGAEAQVLEIQIEHNSPHAQHNLASFRVELTSSSSAADWSQLPQNLRTVATAAAGERSSKSEADLRFFFHENLSKTTEESRNKIARTEQRLASIKPATSVPIMRRLDATKLRETHIQIRGNYRSLGKQVHAGTPAVFHPIQITERSLPGNELSSRERTVASNVQLISAANSSRAEQRLPDRLDLAKWLVDRRNPLTARVWVNRMWESLFGLGIVRSSEDFGAQGDLPTHPDLLDWLAVEFMESGWNNKQLLRTIVLSQTYRQTSEVSPQALLEDQDNIWLSRGPRVRLSAEMVRDQALFAGDLLSQKRFGPPVKPPQPNLGLKAAFGGGTDWQTSQGEDRFRRGIYTLWRRSSPYPSMATFDAPSREVCTLHRDVTNTPLQALVTLNDPAFIEAAQALARRVTIYEAPAINGSPTDSSNCDANLLDAVRLSQAFELCTSRPPSKAELELLRELLGHSRLKFETEPMEAMQLATNPIGEIPPGASATELAAWTAVCNVLLNLDEVLMKR